MTVTAIELPMEKIAEFCHKWQVTEFALFGSVLREDFRLDSDVDILVTFSPTAKRGLAETLQMRDELQVIFNRKVDLIVKAAIERSLCSMFCSRQSPTHADSQDHAICRRCSDKSRSCDCRSISPTRRCHA